MVTVRGIPRVNLIPFLWLPLLRSSSLVGKDCRYSVSVVLVSIDSEAITGSTVSQALRTRRTAPPEPEVDVGWCRCRGSRERLAGAFGQR